VLLDHATNPQTLNDISADAYDFHDAFASQEGGQPTDLSKGAMEL
jgi:hypothetical protein